MEFLNFTKFIAGYTIGLRPDGREVLVIVVKGTFTIPKPGDQAELAGQQLPLVDADVFSGEPGFSAPVHEVDYAPIKPRCDVLLNGSAHAPDGRPSQKLPVVLRVATLAKTFNVVGPRKWTRGLAAISASEPEYFVKMPISYDNAFGGIDATVPDKPRYFPENHAGKGYSYHINLDSVIGQPLPNTEEIDNPVSNPRGSYRPMAFGPIGRAWQPRAKLAGTYDQDWMENVCPFLPADFKDDYYQAAPADQQMPYLSGGEEVSLINLTPEGRTEFRLPTIDLPVNVLLRGDTTKRKQAARMALDSLVIEPDERRFSLAWRTSWPLQKNLFEIRAVTVGHLTRGVQVSIDTSKPYYRSLGEYVRSQHADEG